MKRSAFTLTELLTVITVIGILTGILLPAVQSMRESARINGVTAMLFFSEIVEPEFFAFSDAYRSNRDALMMI